MNNLVSNFDQIVEFAKTDGVPSIKKRAIVREYVQVKLLNSIYANSVSKKLSFVGGTSLRLLRNLDRFSEDIDFDNLGLETKQIDTLIKEAVKELRQENIKVELIRREREKKSYYEVRLAELLYDLRISTNPKEKLRIKIDYSDLWQGQRPEVVLLDKYGLLENVVTNTGDQLLVQKLAAYVDRPRMQPRDVYDVVRLYSWGFKLDREFMRKNKLTDLVDKAESKLSTQGITRTCKQRLKPFLFDDKAINKLDLFNNVLNKLK